MPILKCPDLSANLHTEFKKLELTIYLVTPMFGGGTVAREIDKTQPIRETSIRGQLQFWWRATAGAHYINSKDLFKAHEKIWGSTKFKSKISIKVNQSSSPNEASYSTIIGQGDALKYALFPFASNNQTPEAKGIRPGYTFNLSLNALGTDISNEDWKHLQNAVKAWINFGGLGSRTRRGCGSLFAEEQSFKNLQEASAWLNQNGSDKQLDWPTLPKKFFFKEESLSPIQAWNQSIKIMRDFRQTPHVGRNEGRQHNRPGRSRFPEADTIRRLTKRHAPGHEPDKNKPNGFPRAEFGLPIIFQFKGSEREGDPRESTLMPLIPGISEPLERFASPLILKPIAVSKEKAVSAIILLNGVRVKKCSLILDKRQVQNSDSQPIRSNEFMNINPSPLNGFDSVLDAFFAYAKYEGFIAE